MFGHNDGDRTQLVAKMYHEALHKANANQIEAKRAMIDMFRYDRRLDSFDHERLATKVMEGSQYGRKLDWSDPYLKRGGQSRQTWRNPGTAP